MPLVRGISKLPRGRRLLLLDEAGWNAAQVQLFLGHHKPSFTLDTYIHLLPQDVPEPTFLDAMVGNGRATQAAETRRNGRPVETVEIVV